MQPGEWWIDDSGFTTFADGDVGDVNHEAVAYTAALGLPGPPDFRDPDYDGPEFQIGERLFLMHKGDMGEDSEGNDIPITEQNCLYLWVKAHGAPKSALTFFGKTGADAREYALKYMGWIRVKQRNIETWKFDDKALNNIQTPDDLWDDEDLEDDENQETVLIEERSTGKTWEVKPYVLLGAKSAEGLKRWAEGTGKWHGLEGVRCPPCPCRRPR